VARRAEDLGKREKAFMVWLGVSQQCILHFIVPIKAFRPKFDSEPYKRISKYEQKHVHKFLLGDTKDMI
jgi:hypothetical protein